MSSVGPALLCRNSAAMVVILGGLPDERLSSWDHAAACVMLTDRVRRRARRAGVALGPVEALEAVVAILRARVALDPYEPRARRVNRLWCPLCGRLTQRCECVLRDLPF